MTSLIVKFPVTVLRFFLFLMFCYVSICYFTFYHLWIETD